MPWGNPEQRSGNFVAHINLRHQFEYETFVVGEPLLYIIPLYSLCSLSSSTIVSTQDYSKDEDAILQEAIRESLNDF